MDTKQLFQELDNDSSYSTLMQLKKNFFREKEEYFVPQHNNGNSSFNTITILHHFPNAKLFFDDKKILRLVVLSNAVFKVQTIQTCEGKIKSVYNPWLGNAWDNQYDIIDCMRRINDAMPEWESEFQRICRENERRITNFEKRRLMTGHNQDIVSKYIDGKIDDIIAMETKIATEDIFNLFKKKGYKYEEREVIPGYIDCFVLLNNIQLLRDYPPIILVYEKKNKIARQSAVFLSAEKILQIDSSIPKWIEEAKKLQLEYDKQEKMEQLAAKTTKILVAAKMKELGYEYVYYENDNTLKIKLQKRRKFVIRFPSTKIENVKALLNSLPSYVDVINNIPMYVRVHYQDVRGEAWMKGESNKL
ncbi:MAG: hypothetical protein J5588_02120 [Bacteroidales bacterium]|nr:hypothetical protein [Bacteroidales bacterium]